MNATAFRKVTAFVTRQADGQTELLTFLHPLGGRQLPAGSVEEGEAPDAAARREVREETGIEELGIVRPLGSERTQMGNSGYLCSAQPLRSQPEGEPSRARVLPRGYKVQITAELGPWLCVAHSTYDFNVDPPCAVETISGWVPRSQVSSVLDRYYFHIETTADQPRSWPHRADGYLFHVEWVLLNPLPQLVAGQQAWLNAYHLRLSMPAHRET